MAPARADAAQLGAWLRDGRVVAVFATDFDPLGVPVELSRALGAVDTGRAPDVGQAAAVAELPVAADLPELSGARASTIRLAVPWQEAAVTVNAGATVDGLAIGAPAEAVRETYPAVALAYVESRWEEGLAVDWSFDPARQLVVFGGAVEVVVPGAELPLRSPPGRVTAVGTGDVC